MPSVLRLLLPQLQAHRPRLGRLRLLVSSGEPLAWGTAGQLAAALPRGTVLINLYGETRGDTRCTETSLGCHLGAPGSC